jgi:hypothetical protein
VALAVDASSPARVDKPGTGSAVATTAAFDPPAGVLVACCSGDGDAQSFTMTNNGSALTWVEIGLRNSADPGGLSSAAQAFYAVLSAGRTGTTVTATYTQANDTSFKVYVVTGADAADPLGGVAEGSTTTQNFTTTAFTAESASSLGFIVLCDFDALGSATATSTTMDASTISGQISSASGYKTLGAAGSSSSFDVTAGGAAPTVNYVTFEIEPAGASLDAATTGATTSAASVTATRSDSGAVTGTTTSSAAVAATRTDTGAVAGSTVSAASLTAARTDPAIASGATTSSATVTAARTDTAAISGATTSSAVVTASIPGAVSGAVLGTTTSSAVVTATAPPLVTAGSWYQLVAITAEARELPRTNVELERLACPNDGEPYLTGPDSALYCPYDGYRPGY